MNKLDTKTRAQILSLLVAGSSMRSISRAAGVSINTVTKLLESAGRACAAYHSLNVRDVQSKRVQCDEIWSFSYAKQKNVAAAEAAPEIAGDVWTWAAIDADTKLIIAYLVGGRDTFYAETFMHDVACRLATRVQATTDGHGAYLRAVEGASGVDVDYAMLVKLYGAGPESARGRYSPAECIGARKEPRVGCPMQGHISTSYVERQNLTMRMSMHRFTRLSNGFSKKIDNHVHMLSLYFVHYNFCQMHKTLRMSPAMAAGLAHTLRDAEWIVSLIDSVAQEPAMRGPYKEAPRRNFKLRH
ncbi:transposase [Youhaiella tibetensis]|uniref:IS1 family transposase n=1 Tax=Paradevosia tibetensis TaxID=1447062 RepID=A0A5B9DHS9_9HYPH|nr:IS1 family transposase [Youhaiella tibetensis]QEE18851.1 IS1 family transposase [Youhaiella tibetensis]GGF38577.1 transposase [Youhaiella tibetensis]